MTEPVSCADDLPVENWYFPRAICTGPPTFEVHWTTFLRFEVHWTTFCNTSVHRLCRKIVSMSLCHAHMTWAWTLQHPARSLQPSRWLLRMGPDILVLVAGATSLGMMILPLCVRWVKQKNSPCSIYPSIYPSIILYVHTCSHTLAFKLILWSASFLLSLKEVHLAAHLPKVPSTARSIWILTWCWANDSDDQV